MCIGVPMRVLAVDGLTAVCEGTEGPAQVDLTLTGPLNPGTWVLVFLGAAREALDPERAAQIASALEGLRRAMQGEALGAAFADLEARVPDLPPHLEAARRAGRAVA